MSLKEHRRLNECPQFLLEKARREEKKPSIIGDSPDSDSSPAAWGAKKRKKCGAVAL